jgi:hypothetical protein
VQNRRGVDLFQVLGERLRPGSSERKPTTRRRESRGGNSGKGVWDTVREDAGALWRGARERFGRGGTGPSRRAKSSEERQGPPVSAGLLMTVLAIGLAVGFVLGRSAAPSASGENALDTRVPTVRDPQTPSAFEPAPFDGPVVPTGAELQKQLSGFAIPVLSFSPDQSEPARRLVEHLVRQGFRNARISPLEYRGKEYLMVVVYAEEGDTHTGADLIRAEPPKGESRWQEKFLPYLHNNPAPRAWPPGS